MTTVSRTASKQMPKGAAARAQKTRGADERHRRGTSSGLFAADPGQMAEELFRKADRLLEQGLAVRAAKMHEAGLAILLQVERPMRRDRQANLDLITDFRRDRKSKIVGLAITGPRMKAGSAFEADFSPLLIARLHHHIQVHRPILCPADSTRLFSVQRTSLSRGVAAAIATEGLISVAPDPFSKQRSAA